MENKTLLKSSVYGGLAVLTLTLLFSLSAFAQTRNAATMPVVPSDFKGDGCTHFPDGDYADCCFDHDKAYYVGGSWTQRWRADKKLYQCVAAKKGFEHKLIAPVMWAGVRVFAVPFLPTKFRWGFGKDVGNGKRKVENGKLRTGS